MRLLWLAEARADLRHIRDYIAKRNPAAAKELAAHIRKARDQILAHPDMQPVGDIPGTRQLVIRKYGCVIVYRIKDADIEIIWVFGPGQDRAERASDDPR